MAGIDEKDGAIRILERIEAETTAAFEQYYPMSIELGINRNDVMKLILNRLSETFARFREELKMENKRNKDGKNDYRQQLAVFSRAAREMITEKLVTPEMEGNKRLMNLLQQHTACNMDHGAVNKGKKSANVNMTNKKSETPDESLIFSVEMSGKNAPKSKMAATKRSKRNKRRKKKTKMTIAAVLDQSSHEINQHATITKDKIGSLSISDMPIQDTETAQPTHTKDANDTKYSSINTNKETQPKESQATEIVKYRCPHCINGSHWIETFNEIKDIYSHWLSWHTDPSNEKPFRYIVIEYASCYYCQTIGNYFELLKHHKDCHHTEPVVIVSQINCKKCALCSYVGSGIIAHFDATHKLILKTITNRLLRTAIAPHRLTNAALNQRLESKVHRKLKCGHCSVTFDSDGEMRDHHNKCHSTTKLKIKEFYDNHNSHLICNCCHIKVDRNLYLNHVECSHAFNFKCSNCNFHTTDMLELVNHDKKAHGLMNSFGYRCLQWKNRLKSDYMKTLVIFGNGFVCTQQNLLETKYSDYKQFKVFVETLMKIKKERWNDMRQ